MTRETEEILKKALALPPEARWTLVGRLLDSLDHEVDDDADAAWEAEIATRLDDLEAGRAELVPWAEVRRRLFER
jgi:putative addiction module component (TIGR02574 family)